jgi:uncharacterized protein with von Willebrand factor type A (vWA) domain
MARPVDVAELYWLGRITLLSESSQIPVWDGVFAEIFGGFTDVAEHRGQAETTTRDWQRELRTPPAEAPDGPGRSAGSQHDVPLVVAGTGSAGLESRRGSLALAASAEERLRNMDFALLTEEELALLRALMTKLTVVAPPRPSRRRVRSNRGSVIDMRATLSRAHRTGGQPLVLRRRRRRTRPRRLVFLCDVSGSMEPYSRAYLQLLLSAVGAARAEAFVFSTRLTRLTRSLRVADADLALRQAGRAAPDWSGGTRIADAIKAFIDDHGRAGMARGAVIVIISDGWERGDPAALGVQMSRLRRLAHRVVWVNPRRARAGYQPLVGGMAAALPHVDDFVSGHSISALDEVLVAIATDDRVRPA